MYLVIFSSKLSSFSLLLINLFDFNLEPNSTSEQNLVSTNTGKNKRFQERKYKEMCQNYKSLPYNHKYRIKFQ